MSILSLTSVSTPAGRSSVFSRLGSFMALAKQRAALANLDDAALRDIGVSRAAALKEAERAPWDVPANWRG